MNRKNRLITTILVLVIAILACQSDGSEDGGLLDVVSGPETINIEATSSVSLLEDAGVFEMFEEATGIQTNITYYGDVDLRLKVAAYEASGATHIDGIWVGSPIWAPGRLLQEEVSIMRTYVVAGIDPDIADSLGWGESVTMDQFLNEGIRTGALALAAPNASQDDAGANFLFATISALNPGRAYVDQAMVDNPTLQEELKTVFSAVAGSDSDAKRLADRFVIDQKSGNSQFNGFILPEALAISANLELEAAGKDAMRIFYISDAVGVQSYQLGWVKGISEAKTESFRTLVRFLLDQGEFADDGVDIQGLIQDEAYFRTGLVGMTINNPDTAIFNSDWGIVTDQDFVPANLPKDDVVTHALNTYQLLLKKPRSAVMCLDFSGSMDTSPGAGQRDAAMTLLLDQAQAATYLLQAGEEDITYVFKFHDIVEGKRGVAGNDPNLFNNLLAWTVAHDVYGGTNIYQCAYEALQELITLEGVQDGTVLPSVILLTDGDNRNNSVIYQGRGIDGLERYYNDIVVEDFKLNIPIYTIMLGDANDSDLKPLVELTNSAICDGRGSQEELIACFRDFLGSN